MGRVVTISDEPVQETAKADGIIIDSVIPEVESQQPVVDAHGDVELIHIPVDLSATRDVTIPLPPRNTPLLSYPFAKFNPVQTAAFPYANYDCNVVVAAATSVGKTVIAEMLLAETIWQGGKGCFISPLKAVANEKYGDWTTKNFSFGAYALKKQLNVSICTGDFQLTPQRATELALSHLIVMTPEMLDSRSRRQTAEGNTWLRQIGTLVADEAHLIGMADRGHRLESALMRFSKHNQSCRLVALSATLPNVEQLAHWFTRLNGKKTIVVQSDWRPCQLNIEYLPVYPETQYYNSIQAALSDMAMNLVQRYRTDKILVFVHSKAHGRQLVKKMADSGIIADFHSADLNAVERDAVERKFKNDPRARVMIATSTLAWGVNMPARRVIICGSKRGMSHEVHSYDIRQMCGRAGRTGFDVIGDAHVLLNSASFIAEKQRLENLPLIQSQIRQWNVEADIDGTLAFHLISEFHNIPAFQSNYETARKWYRRSFAAYQDKDLSLSEAKDICNALTRVKALEKHELGDDDARFAVTGLGKVASYMYLNPYDVFEYFRNFTKLFSHGADIHEDAAALAWCISNTATEASNPTYLPEKDNFDDLRDAARDALSKVLPTASLNSTLGVYLYLIMSGKDQDVPPEAHAMLYQIRQDLQRAIGAIALIDKLYAGWKKPKWYWDKIEIRILYAVNSLQAELCLLPGVGRAISDELIKHGVLGLADFVAPENMPIVNAILKSRADKAFAAAIKIRQEVLS